MNKAVLKIYTQTFESILEPFNILVTAYQLQDSVKFIFELYIDESLTLRSVQAFQDSEISEGDFDKRINDLAKYIMVDLLQAVIKRRQ